MRITLCSQEKVKQYHLGVETVLDVLEMQGALVTDESTLSDFVDDGHQGDYECAPDYRYQISQLFQLSRLAGRKVDLSTYVWEVGKWIEGY